MLNMYGLEKVAYYLVEKMAQSDKSRTATDIISFTISDPDSPLFLKSCLNTPVERLVAVALDKDLHLTHRITALKIISGFSERQSNGYHCAVSKARLDLLECICEASVLPEVIYQAVLLGNSKTEGLNVSMLLAYETLMEATEKRIANLSTPSQEYKGINLAALDMYCRSGRKVISQFVESSKLLQRFLVKSQVMYPTTLVGTALFIIEGSLLNHEFIFTGSQIIKEQIENMELKAAGLKTRDEINDFISLMNEEMPLLNQIRTKHINSFAEMT